MDKDKQMEFLFEEGGIADDGMTRDPVSGNEVPPGSLAEEVRDDIPAQLSEGEYVVPADVVRYYGVKFFEDLRGQAKAGLNQMEEDGRIGGEPVPMTSEEELSPEEMAEIQSMMSASGFNEGGLATDPTQVTFDPSQFRPGFSFLRPSQRPETRNVTLYGPNGEIEVLVLPAQQTRYNQLLAEGYSTQQDPGAAVTPEASLEIAGSEDSGGQDFTTFSGAQPKDYSEMTTEELQSNLDGLRTMGRIGGALAVAVNPLFGAAARAGLGSIAANLVQELEARGVDMSDYREERGRDIFGGGLSMYDGLQDQPGSRSGVDFGDTWLGDMLGFDGKAGVQGPGLKESREGARRDFSTTSATSTAGSDRDSNAGNGGTSSSKTGGTTGSGTSGTKSSSGKASAGASGAGAPGGGGSAKGAGPGGRDAVGPMNKGGFVSRRNKNKK